MYSKDELRALKTEFWESFAVYCELQPYLRGRKKMWLLYDTKIKGVELKFDASRQGASVILEVCRKPEEDCLEMFEKLTWYKEAIEKDFSGQLIWDICYTRESGQQVSRVYLTCTDIDFHRREHWGQFFSFMAQNMYQLENNFLDIVEYIRE